MNHLFKITVLLALLGLSLGISATHNRSGEISTTLVEAGLYTQVIKTENGVVHWKIMKN